MGTDSHTTMVNGLGVLGWGVGGIEAEAAMLGQPVSMLIPQVVGFRLEGELPEGATATDLVLTVTQMLRERGVVGKFVEFFGPGLAGLPLADRATIGNMAPEMGATCAHLPGRRRDAPLPGVLGPPARSGWSWWRPTAASRGCSTTSESEDITYSDTLALDLSTVEPSLAGPRRPQDRVALRDAASDFRAELGELIGEAVQHEPPAGSVEESSEESFPASDPPTPSVTDGASAPGHQHHTAVAEPPWQRVPVKLADGTEFELDHGAVVIAAITSCTNTSNPAVMLGAGPAGQEGGGARAWSRRPWVKTSLAPGSKVVTDYLERAGLIEPLEQLGFSLVGYGCTTCIGNSGPLAEEISKAVLDNDLAVCSVLSGNRNFEGRIHPEVKMNYLASPPLCVAYALAGRMDMDVVTRPAPGRRPPARHLAEPARGERRDRAGDRVRHVQAQLRRGVRGRRDLELAAGARGRSLRLGPGVHLRQAPALLRGHARGARRRRSSRSRAPARWRCSATA